ncbi:MAG TPA: sensor histidine kinase, partial [Anaerolineales bacterium]
AYLTRADGSSVEIEYVIDSISLADRVRTVALVRDVTERRSADAELRKSREQLRLFSAELARVREEESSRISREIHDELGQRLTGLKMDLAWVATQLKKGDRKQLSLIIDKTNEMSRLVDDSVKEVRRIATELRPGVLDDLGFAAALEWQAEEFQRRTGITCRVVAPANLAAGDDQSTALFRILQEALTNVSRHARAKAVEVRLSEHDQSILLEIEDDGRGIRAANPAGPGSLGLLGMQERARLVGGETVVERGSAGGTIVRVRLPKVPAGALQDPT